VKKEKFAFDPAVVDHRLEEMRQMRAEQKVADRKEAREGDFVTIDFEGFVDGEAFDGGRAEGHVLELGAGSFIPGFEAQIVGMQREEEKEIEVTFPEDYGNKELAGKKAVFKVKLHEIREKVVPELNDDFAREFGAEGLEDLRRQMAENFQQQEKSRIEGDLRERLVEALVAKNPIEVPAVMVDKQLEYMLQNVRNRMQQQGMTLEMLGMNEEVFAGLYRDTAVKQVQGSLLLEAIGRQEGIEVADDEVEGKFEEIAAMANAPVDAVRQYYSSDEARATLKDQILEEKTLAFLIDNAKIVEVSRQELEAEKAQAETDEATEA